MSKKIRGKYSVPTAIFDAVLTCCTGGLWLFRVLYRELNSTRPA